MTRYVMIIDLTLCAGCETCAVACKQENNLPDGVWWTQLITVEANGNGFGPVNEMRLDYLPLSCQHCMDAPCVEVCPTSAAFRRKDGIIMQDPSLCIGCRYCMAVCPYTGVRVFSSSKPAYQPVPDGQQPDRPPQPHRREVHVLRAPAGSGQAARLCGDLPDEGAYFRRPGRPEQRGIAAAAGHPALPTARGKGHDAIGVLPGIRRVETWTKGGTNRCKHS
ncbi:MAG TPA: 4Fe-4S binding protein [Aggregatilineales bacterium]|nr:4Fe-4S binding protein [Aggregatilineales bacterium]